MVHSIECVHQVSKLILLDEALIIVKGAEAPGVVVVELAAAWGLWAYMSFSIVHNRGKLLWPYRVPYNSVGMVALSKLDNSIIPHDLAV